MINSNNIVDTGEVIRLINEMIINLYDIQDNESMSQNNIVLINDIIGTLEYKFKRPLIDNKKFCIYKL
jgi:hypothetical protein